MALLLAPDMFKKTKSRTNKSELNIGDLGMRFDEK